MTTWLKLLTIAVPLMLSACVSAGTKAITDTGVISQIQVGKSTRADVTTLLGYPITASYGAQGEETWYYTCITAAPTPPAFVPVVKAVTPNLRETRRQLSVTFNQDGAVKNLELHRLPQNPAPSG